MIVIDASVVVEALLNTPSGLLIGARLLAEDESLHTPHLLDIEVAQVLRRYARSGVLDASHAMKALEVFAALPFIRYPHHTLLRRIWELRHNLTAYDAAYVALAEALGAPLLTRDAALASASGHRARIELV